jgi:acetyltransferase-like isoleucine patch superfamily enzyme
MSPQFLLAKLFKKLQGKAIKNSRIHPSSKVEAGSQVYNSSFDRHSFCGYHCEINHCEVGSFCSIANHVIVGGGAHPMGWISTSPAFYFGRDSIRAKFSEHARPAPLRTVIGHDVWIGERALVKAGVTIGTGAVIGMGSVVTHDVAPYSIVAGAPARLLRPRFDAGVAQRLLQSEWWELGDAQLQRAAVHARDPEAFLRALGL